MANPTKQVPTESVPFSEDKVYWPLDPTVTSDVIYTGEMMGMRADTGYAFHFDDTVPMVFLGTKEGIQHRLQSDTPSPTDFKELVRRSRYYSMPLNTGTAAIPTQIGSPAYATDSGHVQVTASTQRNLAGMVVDVGRSGSTGGTGGITTLTGATSVKISPPNYGALIGLVAEGFAGADSLLNAAAGSAANMVINTGRGGNAPGSGAGGNSGRLILSTGALGTSGSGTAGLKTLVELDASGSVPTTAILGVNFLGFKYNAAGTLVAYVNNAGTIKSVSLGTPA